MRGFGGDAALAASEDLKSSSPRGAIHTWQKKGPAWGLCVLPQVAAWTWVRSGPSSLQDSHGVRYLQGSRCAFGFPFYPKTSAGVWVPFAAGKAR